MRKLLFAGLVMTAGTLIATGFDAESQIPQRTPPKMSLTEALPANAFVELAKIINPAVVNISTSVIPRQRQMRRDPMMEMLERFYGIPQRQEPKGPVQMGLGTGFIIREDGLIVTNAHVIEGADIVNVQLTENTDKLYEAKVIGSDKRTDIALIKIEPKGKLPVAALGSSKDIQVGEWVAAFGNPFGHGHTVTKGIISSIGREIGEINKIPLIQTDASINPGNSGGPLVNLKGYVIGVNSAIDARAQGIGFAIPIDEVKTIIPQLEKQGFIRRGYIGAGLADLDPEAAEYYGFPETMGAVITVLERGGPAHKAGIKPYDVVVEFNGKKIRNSTELIDAVADAEIGKASSAVIMRGTKKMNYKITVAERPEEKMAKAPREKEAAQGQEAPHKLGFSVTNPNPSNRADWGFPEEMDSPFIIAVQRDSLASRAGLRVGDIILDVNKVSVNSAQDVIKNLKSKDNTLRIARGGRILIVSF